ncbi:MAG: DNA cytosine methyltransferase [Lentisphaeria bacterium]
MRELALFSGAGGGILGGVLLGWRTVCAVELNAYCARRLMQRQNEGHLPPFPVWDDVCTFDGRPWRGSVDVVSGGFPCQDISVANANGDGIDGKKSGLWREFARIVREVRPRYVLVENSPNLTVRGLGRVLGDLAEVGADARWGVLSAEDFGAWHLRQRLWIAADFNRSWELQPQGCEQEQRGRACDGDQANADTESDGRREGRQGGFAGNHSGQAEQALQDAHVDSQRLQAGWSGRSDGVPPGEPQDDGAETQSGSDRARGSWWDVEPGLVRVVHGVANRVDRIRALGNGQVPAVVAGAWETLR